jgi:hypothetical protein
VPEMIGAVTDPQLMDVSSFTERRSMPSFPVLSPPSRRPSVSARPMCSEVATTLYIALVALVAQSAGLFYLLFPELGALAHDVFRRPHGRWASAPLMLVVTPFLAGAVGTLVTRHLPYGLPSIFLTIGSAILIIRVLKSPVAPAISAGLLPLTLGLTSVWYPFSLLFGTILLAGVSRPWRRVLPPPAFAGSPSDRADDAVEAPPSNYSYVPYYVAFLVIAATAASITGWRFLLFPPLAVIGFEMFAHAGICPWADRPLLLPVACLLTATAGVVCVSALGVGPLAAASAIALSILILRVFDLHVPPALAVGLLPFVMDHPSYRFPLSVGAGTALLTLCFWTWRRVIIRRSSEPTETSISGSQHIKHPEAVSDNQE